MTTEQLFLEKSNFFHQILECLVIEKLFVVFQLLVEASNENFEKKEPSGSLKTNKLLPNELENQENLLSK